MEADREIICKIVQYSQTEREFAPHLSAPQTTPGRLKECVLIRKWFDGNLIIIKLLIKWRKSWFKLLQDYDFFFPCALFLPWGRAECLHILWIVFAFLLINEEKNQVSTTKKLNVGWFKIVHGEKKYPFPYFEDGDETRYILDKLFFSRSLRWKKGERNIPCSKHSQICVHLSKCTFTLFKLNYRSRTLLDTQNPCNQGYS